MNLLKFEQREIIKWALSYTRIIHNKGWFIK